MAAGIQAASDTDHSCVVGMFELLTIDYFEIVSSCCQPRPSHFASHDPYIGRITECESWKKKEGKLGIYCRNTVIHNIEVSGLSGGVFVKRRCRDPLSHLQPNFPLMVFCFPSSLHVMPIFTFEVLSSWIGSFCTHLSKGPQQWVRNVSSWNVCLPSLPLYRSVSLDLLDYCPPQGDDGGQGVGCLKGPGGWFLLECLFACAKPRLPPPTLSLLFRE